MVIKRTVLELIDVGAGLSEAPCADGQGSIERQSTEGCLCVGI